MDLQMQKYVQFYNSLLITNHFFLLVDGEVQGVCVAIITTPWSHIFIYQTGTGPSKSVAKEEAAQNALKALQDTSTN